MVKHVLNLPLCWTFPVWISIYFTSYYTYSVWSYSHSAPHSLTNVISTTRCSTSTSTSTAIWSFAASENHTHDEHTTKNQRKKNNEESSLKISSSSSSSPPLTSMVLKVAYDGTRFHGWSAANDGAKINKADDGSILLIPNNEEASSNSNHHLPPLRGRGRSRRNRNRPSGPPDRVRSVEGALRTCLAKIYGNINPTSLVQVEGSSRTDGGVHARGMIAMVYCLGREQQTELSGSYSTSTNGGGEDDDADGMNQIITIPGKRIAHPSSPIDDGRNINDDDESLPLFIPIPFQSDLQKIVFTLNKMLPPDVRVLDISPTPPLPTCTDIVETKRHKAFHPSLDACGKTYKYTFSVGEIHDPTRCRNVWHINQSTSSFNLNKAIQCASLFQGTHDFKAFRGAPRGNEKRRIMETICTIHELTITEEGRNDILISNEDMDANYYQWSVDGYSPSCLSSPTNGDSNIYGLPSTLCRTFCITVKGDRFLYKMVRFLVGEIISCGLEEDTANNDDATTLSTRYDLVREALATGKPYNRNDDENYEDRKDQQKGCSTQRVCAPAHGLILDEVHYGTGVKYQWLSSSIL